MRGASTQAIANVYETREEVVAAIREAGVESVNLIVGIDATASNIDMGRETFGGKSLHSFEPGQLNPYEQTLWATVPILNEFDDDKKVPVLAFGDQRTKDFGALVLDEAAHGHEGVLQAYRRFLQDERTVLSGPTSFIPVLSWAVDQVRRTRTYTVVLLVCDGAVQDVASNSAFLREVVSKYPISVVAVGVGDGRNHSRATPWTALHHFDDNVRAPSRSGCRQVGRDVFQAVMFHQVIANIPPTQVARQRATLAAHVLQRDSCAVQVCPGPPLVRQLRRSRARRGLGAIHHKAAPPRGTVDGDDPCTRLCDGSLGTTHVEGIAAANQQNTIRCFFWFLFCPVCGAARKVYFARMGLLVTARLRAPCRLLPCTSSHVNHPSAVRSRGLLCRSMSTSAQALLAAAQAGQLETVQQLVNDAALARAQSRRPAMGDICLPRDGSHALRAAAEKGHLEVVRCLVALPGVDAAVEDNAAIVAAAAYGHLEVVRFLVSVPGVDAGAQHSFGLRWAAADGHLEVVRCLAPLPGVDPAAVHNFAIRWAAMCGHVEVVRLLASLSGVDPSTRGNEALVCAARYGEVETVRYLTSLPKVDPCAVMQEGSTPACYAVAQQAAAARDRARRRAPLVALRALFKQQRACRLQSNTCMAHAKVDM